MKPVIAIIGRPNVGKSTLFNRLTKSKKAIVDDFAGVTRDRNIKDTFIEDIEITLVDTGGFIESGSNIFDKQISFQIKRAIDSCDIIILILDGKTGLIPFDRELVKLVRSAEKPVYYIVNKIDSEEREKLLYDFYTLGIETIYPVSAEHGYGLSTFLDDISLFLRENSSSDEDVTENEEIIKIAFIGKPNTGKSSLINRILGEERLIVSEIPGTTRDSIDTICKINRDKYLLIDTAGIRRKKSVNEKLEKFSVIKSLQSMTRCDIALIVLDAGDEISEQDIRIAGYAYERGCGCIILLNKWDLIEKDNKRQRFLYREIEYKAPFLQFAPIVTVSALTGLRVKKMFSTIKEVYRQFSFRVTTGELNRIFEEAVQKNEPSLHKGKRLKFYYAAQIETKPPLFVTIVNYPEAVHFSYQRYLINRIRDKAGLDKTPIKLLFKNKKREK